MTRFKQPFHCLTYRDLWYNDPVNPGRHRVRIVLPRNEDPKGRYLFEFQDGSGRREYLDSTQVRVTSRTPLGDWSVSS